MNDMSYEFIGFEYAWKARIKLEAWEKINASPLMAGCATGDARFIVALLAGFWDFVDRFPAIIRGTFNTISQGTDPRFTRFLQRASQRLAGMLSGMESDERAHRALWLKSASMVDLDVQKLMSWRVLPEIDRISTVIDQAEVRKKLLYFVAVEIVAEGISNFLSNSSAFEKVMGQKGLSWFRVHAVQPNDQTTHEEIAYRAAYQLFMKAGEDLTEERLNTTIQECVDLFIKGASACCDAFGGAHAKQRSFVVTRGYSEEGQ
jgi:hypothetical protein